MYPVPLHRSMRRLRFVLLALSLLFLGASVHILLWSNRGGGSLLAYLHEETPEERTARETITRTHEKLYAQRLREDAIFRVNHDDYENALTRLNEAAQIDPEGEGADGGEIAWARGLIADRVLFPTGDAGR
jgi:hypothetical protein